MRKFLKIKFSLNGINKVNDRLEEAESLVMKLRETVHLINLAIAELNLEAGDGEDCESV